METTLHNQTTTTHNVMGVFDTNTDFTTLFTELGALGYNNNSISVIMSKATQNQHFAHGEHPEMDTKLTDKAPEGFTKGAVAGGVLGAIIGGLTLTGSLLIPGAQLLLLGPAIGALGGLAAGAATGGLVGWMVGMGIPEVEAKFYQDAVDQDENVLLVVDARKEDTHAVQDVFKHFKAKKVHTT